MILKHITISARTDSDGNSVRIRTELVRTFRETSVPIRTDSFYIRDMHGRGFSDVGYCHFIYILYRHCIAIGYKMVKSL